MTNRAEAAGYADGWASRADQYATDYRIATFHQRAAHLGELRDQAAQLALVWAAIAALHDPEPAPTAAEPTTTPDCTHACRERHTYRNGCQIRIYTPHGQARCLSRYRSDNGIVQCAQPVHQTGLHTDREADPNGNLVNRPDFSCSSWPSTEQINDLPTTLQQHSTGTCTATITHPSANPQTSTCTKPAGHYDPALIPIFDGSSEDDTGGWHRCGNHIWSDEAERTTPHSPAAGPTPVTLAQRSPANTCRYLAAQLGNALDDDRIDGRQTANRVRLSLDMLADRLDTEQQQADTNGVGGNPPGMAAP